MCVQTRPISSTFLTAWILSDRKKRTPVKGLANTCGMYQCTLAECSSRMDFYNFQVKTILKQFLDIKAIFPGRKTILHANLSYNIF